MASPPLALTSISHQRTPSAVPHFRSILPPQCRASTSELPRHVSARFFGSTEVSRFPNAICSSSETFKFMLLGPQSHQSQWKCFHRVTAIGDESQFTVCSTEESENLVFNAVNMNFFERLSLAWSILFPTSTVRASARSNSASISKQRPRDSNAGIAKQRLKMILFSDRCAVTEEAKQKIVTNIVAALSDFVEIDSRDKVQLSVSADADLGTVYSVTVPVRRVKPEYQEGDEEYTGIGNIEYIDTGEASGCVDVKFNFILPSEK